MPEEAVIVEETFHLWPENVAVLNLWLSVQSQWRTDMGHRTGLDYAGVEVCLGYCAAARNKRGEYFALLQEMERAALDEWAKKSNEGRG